MAASTVKCTLLSVIVAFALHKFAYPIELSVFPSAKQQQQNQAAETQIAEASADIATSAEVHGKDNMFWPKSPVYHFSFGEKLPNMVKDFCSIQDISIVLSDAVANSEQRINRAFRDILPVDVWDQLTKTYGLMWFYDGNILYVYAATESITKVLQVSADKINALLALVEQLGFYSSRIDLKAIKESGLLVASGPPKFITLLDDLAKNMQVAKKIELDDTCIKFFQLKHAWAADKRIGNIVVPGVASTLNRLLGHNKEKNSDFLQKNTEETGVHRLMAEKGILDEFSPNKQKDNSEKEKKIEPQQDQKQNSTPSGGLITTDNRQNAVIVRDSTKNMHFYEELVAKLDVPLELIEIKAAIVSVSNSASFGAGTSSIELKSKNDTHHIKIQPLQKSSGDSKSFDIKGIVNGNEFLTAIRALESSNSAKLLARPSVITMDNMEAIMDRSETIYRWVSGTKVTDMYPITSSTTLKVTPHVIIDENKKPKIQLILDIKDGKNISKDDTNPNISSSSIITQAVVEEGQSVLVGGYFQEAQEKLDSGVPFLKDIPLLGYAFKNKGKSKSVEERMFLITPTIVRLSSCNEDIYKDYFKNVEEGQSLLDNYNNHSKDGDDIDKIIEKYSNQRESLHYTPTSRIFNH